MGFHVCEYCHDKTSSGDVTLRFVNGNQYKTPDMITHYVQDHDYSPPEQFVDDVLNTEFSGGSRTQTRSIATPKRIGYLSGDFPKGDVPKQFLEKLQRVIKLARQQGRNPIQTKDIGFTKPPGTRSGNV